MSNFKNKLISFFYGRYGLDPFGKFMFWVYLIGILLLSILEIFLLSPVTMVLRLLFALLAAYMIFRVMSRNIFKRRNENAKFLTVKGKLLGFFRLQRDRIRDRKTHVFRKCPKCKAVLRLKRIKGDHRAACPRCGNSFDVHV